MLMKVHWGVRKPPSVNPLLPTLPSSCFYLQYMPRTSFPSPPLTSWTQLPSCLAWTTEIAFQPSDLPASSLVSLQSIHPTAGKLDYVLAWFNIPPKFFFIAIYKVLTMPFRVLLYWLTLCLLEEVPSHTLPLTNTSCHPGILAVSPWFWNQPNMPPGFCICCSWCLNTFLWNPHFLQVCTSRSL